MLLCGKTTASTCGQYDCRVNNQLSIGLLVMHAPVTSQPTAAFTTAVTWLSFGYFTLQAAAITIQIKQLQCSQLTERYSSF
jgi:hypothetical protein